MSETTVIRVSGEPGYDITIGRGILPLVGDALPPDARKVLVVHPPTLAAQTEELRVQRAAIARTQRVVRSIAKTEDVATEPVPRAPSA